jgi:2-succinyl-5-enolpyruvyl-6-hydroxy-3-cyclohexene-1-carboxylate synthase
MNANRNTLWATVFADELVRCGLTHAYLSPGSRSAPLALAIERHPRITSHVVIDERSAAFAALGHGRLTGRAALVLTTSGTAAAELLPAIVEADRACVPLLAVTADRPPELRGIGSNQTIDQVHLYGTKVRQFTDLPLPEASEASLAALRRHACTAWTATQGLRPGPVHLNQPLREPLDERHVADDVPAGLHTTPAAAGRDDGRSWIPHSAPELEPEADAVASVADIIALAGRGLIVAGPRSQQDAFAYSALQLARHLGVPVLADPLSQLRCHADGATPILAHYDAWISRLKTQPEWILQFGAGPTSQRLMRFLQHEYHGPRILIDETGRGEDPVDRPCTRIVADASHLAQAVMARLASPAPADEDWVASLRQLDADASAASCPQEADLARRVAAALGPEDTLVVSSSLPIRDLDRWMPAQEEGPLVVANRGASGIDGVLSTACGAAHATRGQTVLLIGDVALAHDLSGLQLARTCPRLTILLMDNGGGAIFRQLGIQTPPQVLEKLFLTPPGLDWGPIAKAHGIAYEESEPDATPKLEATNGPRLHRIRIDAKSSHHARTRADAPRKATKPT